MMQAFNDTNIIMVCRDENADPNGLIVKIREWSENAGVDAILVSVHRYHLKYSITGEQDRVIFMLAWPSTTKRD